MEQAEIVQYIKQTFEGVEISVGSEAAGSPEISWGDTFVFYDPDHNGCEIYWSTGLKARQPYLETFDLDEPVELILAKVEASVRIHGDTGVVNLAPTPG